MTTGFDSCPQPSSMHSNTGLSAAEDNEYLMEGATNLIPIPPLPETRLSQGCSASDRTPASEQRVNSLDDEARADDIRAAGWVVAVHNDYRLSGEAHTFWLFTKDGRTIKGEGKTDAEALAQVRAQISMEAAMSEPCGWLVKGEKTYLYVDSSTKPNFVIINAGDRVVSIEPRFSTRPSEGGGHVALQEIGYVEQYKNTRADYCPITTHIVWTLPHPEHKFIPNGTKVFISIAERGAAPRPLDTAPPSAWESRLLAAHPRSEPEHWPVDLRAKYMAVEIAQWREANLRESERTIEGRDKGLDAAFGLTTTGEEA